jgi:hypothetical protein
LLFDLSGFDEQFHNRLQFINGYKPIYQFISVAKHTVYRSFGSFGIFKRKDYKADYECSIETMIKETQK